MAFVSMLRRIPPRHNHCVERTGMIRGGDGERCAPAAHDGR